MLVSKCVVGTAGGDVQALEEVCIGTIEAGYMTKDLAICVHGDK